MTSAEVDSHNEEQQRRKELLVEAGLTMLHSYENQNSQLSGRTELATSLYNQELTGKELRVWQRFLPTTCTLGSYLFDEIPTEALEEIILAKDAMCFDHIEIWTPEGNSFLGLIARKLDTAQDKLSQLISKLDPMAVGVLHDSKGDPHYFPIARWGEALLPFKDIKSHVRKIRHSAWLIFGVLPILIGLMGIAAFYNGIVQNGYSNMILGTIFSIIGLILIIMTGLVFSEFF